MTLQQYITMKVQESELNSGKYINIYEKGSLLGSTSLGMAHIWLDEDYANGAIVNKIEPYRNTINVFCTNEKYE